MSSRLGGWYRRYRRHTASVLARRRSDLAIYIESLESRIRDGDRVLHLGCGWDRSGVFRSLSERCRIVGVDPDPTAIARFPGDGWEANAEQLPFADESFDAVVCEYVLEHLERPDKVMAEVARVLRIGGIFIALAPNRWSYKSMAAAATPVDMHAWAAARLRPDHRHAHDVYPTCYRLNTFAAVHHSAALHGFRVQQFTYLNNGPTWFQGAPLLFEAGRIAHWAMDRFEALEALKCGFLVVMERYTPGGDPTRPPGRAPLRVRCLSCGRDDMHRETSGFRCPHCGHHYPKTENRIIARS